VSHTFAFEEPRPGLITLAGDVGYACAGAFCALLLAKLDAHPALHVDMLQVTAADLSTVQTMLVAVREARACGKELRFTGYGLVIEELVTRLNLSAKLGGPLAVVWE
jgi:anti-anti-sigma regulatory factor